MKKINRPCHDINDVRIPADAMHKTTLSRSNKSSHETIRRRLGGRFVLDSRKTLGVKKVEQTNEAGVAVNNASPDVVSEDGSLPLSFISSGSWKADNELLAEMEKVEAAMKSDQSPASDVLLTRCNANNQLCVTSGSTDSSHSTMKSYKSSTLDTKGFGVKRKAVKQRYQSVTKEGDDVSSVSTVMCSDSRPTSHDNDMTDKSSPASSPIDKIPKMNSRLPLQHVTHAKKISIKGNPSKCNFPTPEGRFYGRGKCKASRVESTIEMENDISFSPLLETPKLSSGSSDEENEISPKSSGRIRPKSSTRNGGKRYSKTNVPLNVTETPRKSSTRKRKSPKNLMSPVVKVSKVTKNKDPSTDEGPLRSNAIIESVQNKLKPVKKFKAFKSNSIDSYILHHEDKVRSGITSQTSTSIIAPVLVTSSPSSASTTPSNNITSRSANTSVNTSLSEDKRLLKSWGLPEPVLAAYQRQGVTTMFEWQAECLLSPSVLDGGNLIYSAPTSAGKTLVAEILVLKRVLETRKKALIILPFVSVAREKMFSLQRLYQDAGIRVGGYMGSHSPAGGFSALDVAVCTIEKGNGLVNRMMEDGRIQDIGVVVVDELHMVGDSHRGYLLELMLTKLEFLSLRRDSDQRLQIIGMSATLPNLEVLAKWLRAALYRTDFRPVPLSEHIKVDNRIYDSQLMPQGEVPARFISPDDTDHILALCLETVTSSHSVLVFCPTKNWCEKLCETIARKFYQITHSQSVAAENNEDCKNSSNTLTLNKAGLRDSLEQLRRCPVGVDPMLGRCVINGVAYHHAGLTFDERDIIEGAFREGNLRVLIATSTLSSGVNLPARRVIIRTPMFHGQVIDVLTFKQMSGRAGRKGVDTEGESILICKPSEKIKGRTLLQSELPPVESCLYFDDETGLSRSLKRAILEVVVSGVTSSPEDVMSYIRCTLLSASMDENDESGPCTASLIENCITFLQDNEFVTMQTVKKEDGTECKKFFPTQLGSAILASSLSPDEGLLVFAELQKARRSFVLESELHVIYLVTPVYTNDIATSIDWYHFYTLWENLSPAERRVADLVGIREGFIAQAIGGRINKKTEAQRKAMAIHHRFYTSLVLNTLVREVPLMEVAAKFNLNKGQLQSLQQSAATYTGMLTVFCQRLGWHNLELILSRFQRRLSMGVQHELVDLVRISALTASSARMMYNAGYHTVADVARAEAVEVEELFKTAVPFQSHKKQDGETDWERQERQKAKCIWLTGRKGMTELDAAREIIGEAKSIVQGDLGVRDIAWSTNRYEEIEESSSEREEDDKDEEDACPANNMSISDNNDKPLKNTTQIEASQSNSNFTRIKSRKPEKETSPNIQKAKNESTCSAVESESLRPSLRSQRVSVRKTKRQSTRKSDGITDKSLNDTSQGGTHTPLSTSTNGRGVRRKSSAKKRRSVLNVNKSKGNETSFFGQAVVTPPPGLRPLIDERNKSKMFDQSLVMNSGERFTSHDAIQTGRNISKQQPDSEYCNQNIRDDQSSGNVTRKSTWLSKSDCSKQDDIEQNKRVLSEVNKKTETQNYSESSHHKSNSTITMAPTSNYLQPFEMTTSRNSSVDKKYVNEEPDQRDSDNVIIDSKNTSTLSDGSLSFSESFILDTQTDALTIADCEYKLISEMSSPKRNGSNHVFHQTTPNKGDALSDSRIEVQALRRSTRKSTLKLNNYFVKSGNLKDLSKSSKNSVKSDKNDLPKSPLAAQSSKSVNVLKLGDQNGKENDVGYDESIKLSQLISTNPGNVSSNLLQPSANHKNEDNSDDEDETNSLLVASCYDRVSNFDEGMLELSGYDDLGLDNSLSELNIVRDTGESTKDGSTRHNTPNTSRVQENNSISNLPNGVKTLLPSSTSWSSYKNDSRFNHISDTQCTDDSLLAAVDLGVFTSSFHQDKNIKKPVADFDPKCVCEATTETSSALKKRDGNRQFGETKNETRPECKSKALIKSNKNENISIDLQDPPESNFFLSDSLSASLVDQAFAQCDLNCLQTSSPCGNNINTNLCNSKGQFTGHSKTINQTSLHTTPTSTHRHTRRSGVHMEISPVLWDNPDSNTNSLNNSTVSCHDGSDLVPPTPPNEASSHASPLKFAFLSPMTNRKKMTSTSSNASRLTDELSHGKSSTNNSGKLKSIPASGYLNGPLLDESDNIICDNLPLVDHNDEGPLITSQSQLLTQQSFTIIDVCAHPDIFKSFLVEWRSKPAFSLALACEKKKAPTGKGKSPTTGIGSRFSKKKSPRHSMQARDVPSGLPIPNADIQLVGVAVTWEHRDAYYLSLLDKADQECDPNDSLAEPNLCESISLQDRIDAVTNHLHAHRVRDKSQIIELYDTKTAYNTLAKTLGVSLAKCEDPRVADWLREPGSRLKNLHRMVTTYLPDELALLDEVGGGSSYQSLGIDVKSRVSGRIRACTESILTRKLMVEYRNMLEELDLWQAFIGTEMPALLTLCRMELNGFGLSMTELESQKTLMKAKLESIEQTAYNMAGHVFSLTSLDDIAKILYLELKLPLNGDPDAVPHLPTRGTRHRRTVGGTSKEILEKLTKYHPLPALILEWRRISSALTKSLFALQRTAQICHRLDMVRVFGDCQVFSTTGRVAMAEPNIQNIPKDFCVELKETDLHGEASTSSNQVLFQSVSLRKMFVPFTGGVILSADYSQLELRIIAHLSGDTKLCRILNKDGGDVFKLIAAQFKSIDVAEVTATDRQQAKQVCYGMLYGIGPKALGEQIGVCENEATVFMQTFKSTYPGVRKYLRETVEFCQKNGYVKTLFNRRRYLPSIKHTNPHARAQAERQAVNTSVQGSAADLVKKAMTSIDLKLMEMFPDCLVAHSQGKLDASVANSTAKRSPHGGFFLLQLHDELIYEVSARHLDVVARLVKIEMEEACNLCVRMPVKVNVGPSWGQLEEYDFGRK